MDYGISANGSTDGGTSGLTGTSSTGDSSSDTNGSSPRNGATSASSDSFTFPLPRRTPGSYLESAKQETARQETEQQAPGQHSAPDGADASTSTDSGYDIDSYYDTESSYGTTQNRAPSHNEPDAPASADALTPGTDFDALGRTVMRRKAMGEAAVRVAGRLAHAELLQEYKNFPTAVSADPMSEADHLLALLGDYLAAAGFECPELHAKLSGQSIVVNLVSPDN